MAYVRYFVVPHGHHWRVALDGRTMAHVAKQSEALTSAIVMADLMGSMGHEADVMLDDGKSLNLAWTYGVDTARASQPRKVSPPRRARGSSHVRLASAPAAQ